MPNTPMPAHPTTVYAARCIVTMNPAQPQATHVAVRGDRILAVGDLARMQAWGDYTLDTSFADKVLLPGFVEGHCHLKEGSMWDTPYLGWFDRRDPQGRTWPGLRTMDAVVARLVEIDAAMAAAGQAPDAPLIAWGFDPIYFGGARMTVLHIDQVGASATATGQRPIVIAHANGHLLNVNSAMLRLAGIDADTGVEGIVTFDANLDANQPDGLAGQPTGELQEPAAMHLVLRRVGNAGLLAPINDAGLRAFAQIATLQGVTTATDLVNRLGDTELDVLQRCTADDHFAVRIAPAFQAFHGALGAAQGAARVVALQPQSTERLRFGLVKMMLDGSIQGFSARLRWPGYLSGADGHKPNGIWVTAPAQFEADFKRCTPSPWVRPGR